MNRHNETNEESCKPQWIKTKWRQDQLQHKSVRFRLRKGTKPKEGNGHFSVATSPHGTRIDIVCDLPGPKEGIGQSITLFLPQEAEPWIRESRTPEFDFEVLDPSL